MWIRSASSVIIQGVSTRRGSFGGPGSPATGLGIEQIPWRAAVEHRALILVGFAIVALAAGGLLHLAGEGVAGDNIWRVAVALLALELACEVGRTIAIEHNMGVDTIALVAMVGSLALGQELAGNVFFALDVLRGLRA